MVDAIGASTRTGEVFAATILKYVPLRIIMVRVSTIGHGLASPSTPVAASRDRCAGFLNTPLCILTLLKCNDILGKYGDECASLYYYFTA